MKILSIETSCDETAVSVVEATGGLLEPHFDVLGNALFSQIKLHQEYGGVYPNLARREHAKNLVPLLAEVLKESKLAEDKEATLPKISDKTKEEVIKILERETGMADELFEFIKKFPKPSIDLIAVTAGPGLEPALWVGISLANALGTIWNIEVRPVNHMEGHIISVLMNKNDPGEGKTGKIKNDIQFPAVALLISGGHTELVKVSDWGQYEIVGQTRDDAVGEAFDKVARMLSLPYPGGPQISKLAEVAREKNMPKICKLPRPMIHSDNFDFSFSGLKTAVLYYIRDHLTLPLSEDDKMDISREFEDSIVEVLAHKTKQAIIQTSAKTLIIGGGVIANKKIRQTFLQFENELSGLSVRLPQNDLSTDNSVMIAGASYIDSLAHPEKQTDSIRAQGNLRLE